MKNREFFERMKSTRIPEDNKDALWTSIEQELSETETTTNQAKHRGVPLAWSFVSAAAGVVLVGGLFLWLPNHGHGGGGVTAGNVTNDIHNTANRTHSPKKSRLEVRHSFAEKTDWVSPDSSSYPVGLTSVKSPHTPTAFEQSLLPKTGVATIRVSSNSGTGDWNPNPYKSEGIVKIVFNHYSFQINGETYTVPTQYHHQKIVVLPLNGGIVWAPVPTQPKNATQMSPKRLTAKQLKGSTSIFYTPFMAHGGSLGAGATTLARLPHAWRGVDGAVLASAYTGWLPKKEITMPIVKNEFVRHLQLGPAGNLLQSPNIVQGKISDWPNLFKRDLSKPAYSKPKYVASIGSLTRTNGGFVLQVHFKDATLSGRNAGMSGANYYWSEQTGKWTPISQTFTVQTLAGWTDVGSNGVYWIQPCGSKNGFNVSEMHFNPATRTIDSVWLGNWSYGQSFVDGSSWVTVLANDAAKVAGGKPKKWTVYTP